MSSEPNWFVFDGSWFNFSNATAILEYNDTTWDSPLIEIIDALIEADWPQEAIEAAIERWAR